MPNKRSAKIPLALLLRPEEALDLDALAAATGKSRCALIGEAVAATIDALPAPVRGSFERVKQALRDTPRHAPKAAPAPTAST